MAMHIWSSGLTYDVPTSINMYLAARHGHDSVRVEGLDHGSRLLVRRVAVPELAKVVAGRGARRERRTEGEESGG